MVLLIQCNSDTAPPTKKPKKTLLQRHTHTQNPNKRWPPRSINQTNKIPTIQKSSEKFPKPTCLQQPPVQRCLSWCQRWDSGEQGGLDNERAAQRASWAVTRHLAELSCTAQIFWEWAQCLPFPCQACVIVAAEPSFLGLLSSVVGLVSEVPALGFVAVFAVQTRKRKAKFMFCWRWLSFFLLLSFAHCLLSCLDPKQCFMSCNGMELLSLTFCFCSFLKCLPGKLTCSKSLDQQGSTDNCWGQPWSLVGNYSQAV